MSTNANREPDEVRHGERDAFKPFYLTIIETNPGKFEMGLDPGTDFDTLGEAETYLQKENAAYGVGGHVYHCVRVSGMSMGSDEARDPPT